MPCGSSGCLWGLAQSPGLHPPPRSRPLWNNPAISTTTAALKYDASVEISEIFYDDNLEKRHDENSAINNEVAECSSGNEVGRFNHGVQGILEEYGRIVSGKSEDEGYHGAAT